MSIWEEYNFIWVITRQNNELYICQKDKNLKHLLWGPTTYVLILVVTTINKMMYHYIFKNTVPNVSSPWRQISPRVFYFLRSNKFIVPPWQSRVQKVRLTIRKIWEENSYFVAYFPGMTRDLSVSHARHFQGRILEKGICIISDKTRNI